MFTAICDALVSYLNGETFSRSFTAVRVSVPNWELEKITGLTVEVFPSQESRNRTSRDSWTVQYTIGIAIRDRTTSLAKTDAMLALVDELKDSIGKLPRIADSWLVTMEDSEPFEPQLHEGQRVFSHPIVLVFQTEKVLG